jgi:hypothetical protein
MKKFFFFSLVFLPFFFAACDNEVTPPVLPNGAPPEPIAVSPHFTAADGLTYSVSLFEPSEPALGINQISALVYRIDGHNTSPVPNLSLKLDPRMTGMGNHSSPNNVDLTYDEQAGLYLGQVNFTMSGFWTINLILLDHDGNILYGNPVSHEILQSSLFFEIEF